MSKQQTVIYHARTPQDAHLLRNLLAERQIEAVVLDAASEDGLGDDELGWAAAARVAVAEDDAEPARQIALEFDRQAAASAASPTAEGPQPEAPVTATLADEWPRCPECGAPRSTRCPICGTAGSDFSPADMGFVWIPEAGDPLAAARSCSCGPGGGTPAAAETESAGADHSQPEKPAELLMCPTCDEPFPPQYPRLCEWCGHEFADGFAIDLPQGPIEQINSRVIAVIVGLLVLAAAMVAYLIFIVR